MKSKKEKKYLTISEFSRISEISRKALIFYDNADVFKPKYTGPNGYRYYTHEQIYVVSVINVLKELGMPLSEISKYTSDISPEKAVALLKEQDRKLSEKIAELRSIQDMLDTKLDRLTEGAARSTTAVKSEDGRYITPVQVRRFEETPVFVSSEFEADRQQIPDEIWLNFYMNCKKSRISFGYPEGCSVSQDRLRSGVTSTVSRIMIYVNQPKYANSAIPAGYYAEACGNGGLEDADTIYRRLFQFIEENNYQIRGNSCEERLIDEVGSSEKEGQILRVRIPVSNLP